VVVERIKAAGAVVLGKTQVPEFGYSGTGQTPLAPPTRNPWNLERTSGGSSAGSGAAVATGVGPFSLGSDGGGSVRIPASFCGVYGIKPTMGRVPLGTVASAATESWQRDCRYENPPPSPCSRYAVRLCRLPLPV
jgi:aspartyl-tRNA(Asn)/glutamyl-tRNA(Gln) amidotransferase subunit A